MGLSLKQGFEETDIAGMLGAARDEVGPHLLWVSKKGDVWLDVVPASLAPDAYVKLRKDDIQFYFPPFERGKGLVGEKGAADFVLVVRLRHALTMNWDRGFKGVVETY